MQVEEITVNQLSQDSVQWTLLDVRTDEEYAAGHVEGAVHIPLNELSYRMNELDGSRPIAVICRSGGRSQQAAHMLCGADFKAVNVQGGMRAWAAEIDPTITVA